MNRAEAHEALDVLADACAGHVRGTRLRGYRGSQAESCEACEREHVRKFGMTWAAAMRLQNDGREEAGPYCAQCARPWAGDHRGSRCKGTAEYDRKD